ncbi:lipocalin family protein [Rhodobacter ferrooxidans]|uniref:Lipocalin family protein n=1 Tax=Rhodobacter ferrooxidans TaxID=371731 RepID=C8S046_9RHOB|nr:lipocalin family protein [Rhodobacter sp. SW2]EEW25655.1 Lipocalin family protein [Rhodobacter sp. SW2]
MHRLILIAALALTACARPATQTSYRDAGIGLYSNAVFQPERLTGTWTQVAAFAPNGAPGCQSGQAQFTPTAAGLSLTANLCLSGQPVAYTGRVGFIETGRMQLSGADPAGIGQPWWVLWVDTDYRTLVIGTPSGAFGFILNRDGKLPADRLKAAREILDWGGYDLRKLQVFR